jgi:hypothetical protein
MIKSRINLMREEEVEAFASNIVHKQRELRTRRHLARAGQRRTSRTAVLSSVISGLLMEGAFPAISRAQASTAVEPHTQDVVIAADRAWADAESSGNTDYINALLLAEYRSVNSDGSIHDKAAILASAQKNIGHPERAATVDQWRAAHPSITAVQILGDTAVLTFALDRGDPKPVMPCDIFVYREGHWHPIYSQHTEVSK